jgi:serine/threonine-protein kinase
MSAQLWLGRNINGYILETLLGTGASGLTFRASKSGEAFALKLLPAEYSFSSADMRASFDRERRILSLLSHPNIVPLIEADDFDGMPYLVMPYKNGGNLRQFLEGRGENLDYETLMRLFGQIGSALDYAHSRGVLHRDLKPENILVERDPAGTYTAYITDFGIASLREGTRTTRTGAIAGTSPYMAPEVWSAATKSPATDLYSLSAMFYELLEGKLPFQGSEVEMMKQHLMDTPPFPQQTAARFGAPFARTLVRGMDKKPDRRFASARAFQDELETAFHQAGRRQREHQLQRLGIFVGAAATIAAALIAILPALIDRVGPSATPTPTVERPTERPRPTDEPEEPTAIPRPTDEPEEPTAIPRPTDEPEQPDGRVSPFQSNLPVNAACPYDARGFWLPRSNLWYGPTRDGRYVGHYSNGGFGVWTPWAGETSFPDPFLQIPRNSWHQLGSSGFYVCVDTYGNVFAMYTN